MTWRSAGVTSIEPDAPAPSSRRVSSRSAPPAAPIRTGPPAPNTEANGICPASAACSRATARCRSPPSAAVSRAAALCAPALSSTSASTSGAPAWSSRSTGGSGPLAVCAATAAAKAGHDAPSEPTDAIAAAIVADHRAGSRAMRSCPAQRIVTPLAVATGAPAPTMSPAANGASVAPASSTR